MAAIHARVRMGLVVAAAVLLCAWPSQSVELEVAGGAGLEGFHLDDYLAGGASHARAPAANPDDEPRVVGVIALQTNEQTKVHSRSRARATVRGRLRFRETEAEDATAGAQMHDLLTHMDDALDEAQRADTGEASHRDKKDQKNANGGTTSVVANRNYMSIMEDAQGRILDPADAAKEERFQQIQMKKDETRAKEAAARRKDRQIEKENEERSNEEESKKNIIEMKSERLEDEVREAQEAAAKTNERNFKAYQREHMRKMQQQNDQEKTWMFGEDWQNYGGRYEPVTVAKRGNICVLSGLVMGRNGTIGKVPEFCAPGQRLMFSVLRAGVTGRVDITGDGRVLLVDGIRHGWLSLSGIIYAVNINDTAAQKPQLTNGWREYGLSWRPTSVTADNGVCLLSGLIKIGAAGGNWTFLGQVPEQCKPDSRLAFSDCNHEHVTRVDVLQDGRFLKAGGYQMHGWVSLDGMVWTRAEGRPFELLGDWKNYGGSYRGATYSKVGDICFLSGLVVNPQPHWREIGALPGECRPRARLVFACNNHASSARVDVDVDGTVRYVSGRSEHNWLSLSCIHFVTAPQQ